MKLALYTRVSTDHIEQKTSLENQKTHYEEYCIKNNLELYKIYADEGLSATSPNRKEFLDMLYDAGLDAKRTQNNSKKISFEISERKSKFDLIITKDVSRFARNTNAIDILRALVEKGVHVEFENMNVSTEHQDWEFRVGLLLLLSQQESIDKSYKVKFAYKQRAKNGKFHMSVSLYGYDYNPVNKETTINKEQAAVVKEIFNMYVNKDMGTYSIAKYLNNNKYPTKKDKQGKTVLWNPTTIKRMIKNEKYTGVAIVNKTSKVDMMSSNKRIVKDESEWILIEDALPIIIDNENWMKAQEIMAGRVTKDKDGKPVGDRSLKNMFYQKIFCGKCEAPFKRSSANKVRKGKKVTEINYFCRTRRIHGQCDMRGISHNVLTRLIKEIGNNKLHELIDLSIQNENGLAEQAFNQIDQKRQESEEKIRDLRLFIEERVKEIDDLTKAFLSGNQSPTIIKVMTEKIEEIEKQKQEAEMKIFDYSTAELDRKEQRIKSRLAKINSLNKKKKFSFDEVMEYIQEIIINEGKEVTFRIKSPSVAAFSLDYNLDNIENQYFIISHTVRY